MEFLIILPVVAFAVYIGDLLQTNLDNNDCNCAGCGRYLITETGNADLSGNYYCVECECEQHLNKTNK